MTQSQADKDQAQLAELVKDWPATSYAGWVNDRLLAGWDPVWPALPKGTQVLFQTGWGEPDLLILLRMPDGRITTMSAEDPAPIPHGEASEVDQWETGDYTTMYQNWFRELSLSEGSWWYVGSKMDPA